MRERAVERLPGALPVWLTTSRLVTAGHALGLLGCLIPWIALQIAGAPPLDGLSLAEIGLIAPLPVGAVLAIALAVATSVLVGIARSGIGAAAISFIGTAAAFSASRCGVVIYIHAYVNAQSPAWDRSPNLAYVVRDLLGACFVGAVLGLLVGLPLARPAVWFVRQAKGTLDATSGRALFGVGVWLFVPVAISALPGLVTVLVGRQAGPALLLCVLVTPCLAVLGAIFGARLAWRRSRWLASVRRGDDPAFRVRPAGVADGGLPSLEAASRKDGDVLEAIVSTGDADPYRAVELVQPIARMKRER